MEIGDVLGGGTVATTATRESGANATLGQEDFLAMLIAQLENQDPLDPQDATEFTAQLAQFSSLDQLISMRTSIDALTQSGANSQNLAAAGLIGREALVDTQQVGIPAGPDAELPTLFLEASRPTNLQGLELINGANQVVARLPSQTLAPGRNAIDWASFNQLPQAGVYTVRLTAAPGEVAPNVLVQSRVTGTRLDGDAPTLVLNGVETPLGALREVSE
ncbi:MAG: flagellar hook assembly protein FlgD [Myxococcota bacterium]